MLKDFVHIINPNSKKKAAVAQFFKENPAFNTVWVERTSHPAHLETVVQWAVNEGYSRIAVWGGDGTLSRAVNEIYRRSAFDKMIVALVPVGTCNDFAKRMEIPVWETCVAHALASKGREELIDVGLVSTSVGERTFINNAGFGRTRDRFRARSNPVKDILAFSPKKIDVEWQSDAIKHSETRTALLGVVCNAPYFNGAMYFDKSISPTDGSLSGFFEMPQSTPALLWKLLRARMGRSLFDERTFRIDAQKILVSSDNDLFPQVDGEPAVDLPVRSISFSILDSKLRFFTWS